MAQTTSHFQGDSITVEIDNTSGTLTAMGGSTSNISIAAEPAATGEVYTFDGDNPLTGSTGVKWTISGTGVASTTAEELFHVIAEWSGNVAQIGTAKTGQVHLPNDTNVPRFDWAGEWKLTSFSVAPSASEGAPLTFDFEMVSDGTITYTHTTV